MSRASQRGIVATESSVDRKTQLPAMCCEDGSEPYRMVSGTTNEAQGHATQKTAVARTDPVIPKEIQVKNRNTGSRSVRTSVNGMQEGRKISRKCNGARDMPHSSIPNGAQRDFNIATTSLMMAGKRQPDRYISIPRRSAAIGGERNSRANWENGRCVICARRSGESSRS